MLFVPFVAQILWRNGLIEKERATSISKYLSLVLRHNPAAAGVMLDAEGWVDVEDLLAGAARHGHSFTREELEEVVQKSDKQRFAFSLDVQRIRANQGHSVSWFIRLRIAVRKESTKETTQTLHNKNLTTNTSILPGPDAVCRKVSSSWPTKLLVISPEK